MEDCTVTVQEEVELEVMSFSTLFPDYKDTFTPCKQFPSREAVVSWLQMIGRENMFVLVTKHSDTGGIKRRGRVKLACERSGTYRGMSQRVGKGKAAKISKKSRNDEKARTQTGTKKCGCPFLINVKENADSLWYVTVICGRHNHDPAKNLDGHSFAGRLDKGEQEVVVQMTKGNVKPKDILDTLKRRDVRNVSTMRTIYNARQKVRNEDVGGRTQIQQLREISRPSSTPGVVPPAKIKTKGRTPGSPIGGKAVSKRKHDDDDSSTRRLPSGFESSHSTKEASTSRQKKGKVVPIMRRASRRTQNASNMAYGHCLEPDWLPHVEGIIDVVSDGNCGYRCVASGLRLADVDGWRIVRRRMYDEIIGYEDLWREVLGSSFETVKNAVHCP
ncbi:hypothetical protein Scep_021792 [Stephania cephalantha]|uniref:FAR1 domain-containing protein n=1 Tax=Stephania cephalantha TaxID=152367 RepID=A0AAP0FCA1_9MAGN